VNPMNNVAFQEINLKNVPDQELLHRFGRLVQTERKITYQVLKYIAEIEMRKLYLPSYISLFDFLVEKHGYSESAARRRISSAEILTQVPQISTKVEKGTLSLTQLDQVHQAIRFVQKTEKRKVQLDEKVSILSKIENSTQRETNLILAQELSIPLVIKNKETIHRDESVTLTITFSKEQMALLEQVQDLIAHSVPDKRWSEVMTYLAQKEVDRRTKTKNGKSASAGISSVQFEKVDQVINAQSAKVPSALETEDSNIVKKDSLMTDSSISIEGASSSTNAASALNKTDSVSVKANFTGKAESVQRTAWSYDNSRDREQDFKISEGAFYEATIHARKAISPSMRKFILNRDKCCQFKDPLTGKICGCKRFLQVDHIQPIWAGGTNDIKNLQAMCAQHNQFKYRKESGQSSYGYKH